MPFIFYGLLAVILVIPSVLLVKYVKRRKSQPSVKRVKKSGSRVSETERIEKLKKLIQVSQKMKVAQIAKILDMSEEDLYKQIFDWVSTFGFTLNEDVVDFSGDVKTDAFIDALEKDFKTLGKSTEKV